MGGVDRLDENVSCYQISIRGKKWYCPLICYLIDVSVNNEWLFARKGNYSGDLLSFTQSIVQHWLKKYGTPTRNPGKQRIKALATMTTNDTRFHEGRTS